MICPYCKEFCHPEPTRTGDIIFRCKLVLFGEKVNLRKMLKELELHVEEKAIQVIDGSL